MSRNSYNRQQRLDYKNDIQLFESTHFIAVANQYQRRSHLIIRARREMEDSVSNNLEDFDDETKTEFWHMVQQIVADTKKPSMLCHHYGGWRSANHFHVHIVFQKRDFAEYVARKANNMDDLQHIIDLISKKSEQLVKRHLEEFKKPEVEEIKNDRPDEFDEDHVPFKDEYGEYRVELDNEYPWIKFIRKVQPKYSSDQREVIAQLQKYRQECFSTMYSYATEVANLSSVFFSFFFFTNFSFEFGLSLQGMYSI